MIKFRVAALSLFLTSFANGRSALSQPPTTETFHSPDRTYYTIDGAQQGGESFNTGGPVLANAVLTSQEESILLALTLNVRVQLRDLGSFDIFVSNIDASGQPYSTKVIGTVSDRMLTKNFQRMTIQFGSSVPLAKNKRYYVGIRRRSGAHCSVILGTTTDSTVLSRPEVAKSGISYINRGPQPNQNGVYQMIVALRA